MYLSKLLIKNYGKFNNEEIKLEPGVNVIRGSEGSGKTTIKDFIVSMLYGFTNCALNEKRTNKFEQYKPQNGGVYSGKAYLNDDDKTYFVERSFARKNSRTNVLELKSGRDVKLVNDNLDGKLFDCCRDDFVNGLCIGGKREDYEEYIKNDLEKMIVTGASSINLDKSIFYLKKKRKEYSTSEIAENIDIIDSELEDYEDVDKKLRDVRKRIRDVEEELAIETARRKREARRLIQTKTVSEEDDEDAKEEKTNDDSQKNTDINETIKDSVEKSNENSEEMTGKNVFLDADLLKDYKPEVKLSDRIWFIILTGLFVIGVISAIVYILPFDNAVRQIFIICTILFVIVTIVEGLYAKGVFEEDVKTPSEEEFKRIIYELERKTETYEEVDIDMSFAQTYIGRREELIDEERKILKDMSRRDELREEKKAQELKLEAANKEIHAINLAINTINDLSKDISKTYSFMINNNISDIISRLSDNKLNDLYVNESNKLLVMGTNGYIDISNLSGEEITEVYLSVRFAIAKSMSERNMPIVLDGVLDGLDDAILSKSIDIVQSIKTDQLIIMSSDDRVEDIIKSKNENCNFIQIS